MEYQRGTYSLNNVVDRLLGLVNLVFSVGHDQTMQVLLLIAGVSGIRTAFSFLDGTFSANGDLCAGFGFHFLESVTTRSNE